MGGSVCVAAALTLVVSAGCAFERGDGAAASRVERCTDSIVERAEPRGLSEDDLRRYVERTYCSRFEEEGWIYDDGTLSIDVHTDTRAEECAVAEPGKPSRTVPCEQLESGFEVLDCAILHHVRKSEVQAHLAELMRRHTGVQCDDGTPLDELGAE